MYTHIHRYHVHSLFTFRLVRVSIFSFSTVTLTVSFPSISVSSCGHVLTLLSHFFLSLAFLVCSTDTVTGEAEDNGKDNPFRPDGGLAREAELIVELIKAGKPIKATSPTQEDIDELQALRTASATGHSVHDDDVDFSSNLNSPVDTDHEKSKSHVSSPSKNSSHSPSHASATGDGGKRSSPTLSLKQRSLNNNNYNSNGKDVSIASPKDSLNADNLDSYALVEKKNSKGHCCSLQ